MQYRLRSLVAAAAVGPPLLALLYFGAIWVANVFPSWLQETGQSLFLLGVLGAIGLVIYSACAWRPRSTPAVELGRWQCVVLWVLQFVALQPWIEGAIHFGGWILIWGDNGPPIPDGALGAIAAVGAAAAASITTLRIVVGSASVAYVLIVAGISTMLLALTSLFGVERLLR